MSPILQPDLREAVADVLGRLPVRDFSDPGGELDKLRCLEAATAILALVSSTGWSGDQSSVASGLTPLVASREADSGPADPSGGEWTCVNCGTAAKAKRPQCACGVGLLMSPDRSLVVCDEITFRDPKSERDALLTELRNLVDWLEDNKRTIDGEFSMDELLAGPRATIAKSIGVS